MVGVLDQVSMRRPGPEEEEVVGGDPSGVWKILSVDAEEYPLDAFEAATDGRDPDDVVEWDEVEDFPDDCSGV